MPALQQSFRTGLYKRYSVVPGQCTVIFFFNCPIYADWMCLFLYWVISASRAPTSITLSSFGRLKKYFLTMKIKRTIVLWHFSARKGFCPPWVSGGGFKLRLNWNIYPLYYIAKINCGFTDFRPSGSKVTRYYWMARIIGLFYERVVDDGHHWQKLGFFIQ